MCILCLEEIKKKLTGREIRHAINELINTNTDENLDDHYSEVWWDSWDLEDFAADITEK